MLRRLADFYQFDIVSQKVFNQQQRFPKKHFWTYGPIPNFRNFKSLLVILEISENFDMECIKILKWLPKNLCSPNQNKNPLEVPSPVMTYPFRPKKDP